MQLFPHFCQYHIEECSGTSTSVLDTELLILDLVVPITAALIFPVMVYNSSNLVRILLTFKCKDWSPLLSKDFQKDWETLFGVGRGFKLIIPDKSKSIWWKLESNFWISMQRWQQSSLENDDKNCVNGCIDPWTSTEEKYFVKYFLSWDCKSEFASSKASFENINE